MPSAVVSLFLLLALACPPLCRSESEGGEEENFEFQVTEGAKIGSTVGKLDHRKASKDLDFSFTQPSRFFSVSRSSGELRVKSMIDREALCHFHATCCPQELEQQPAGGAGGEDGKRLSNSCYIPLVVILKKKNNPVKVYIVRVYVQDVNDEPPKFPSPQQNLKLAEDAPVGTKLRLQSAHDPDHSIYATRSYKLEHCDADIFNLTYSRTPGRRKGFDVNLILTRRLDREVQSRYRCRVTASDGVHTESMDVEISVEDVNDNGPRWTTTKFQVSIREDTQRYKPILTLRAVDKDEKYGLVRYRFASDYPMKSKNPFSINMDSGVITVDRDLDYDVKGGRLYHLPVIAYDNGNSVPLSATATVTVSVTDVNDNSPIISVDKNPLRIQENAEPGHLTLVTVRDKDQGRNGRVSCSLPDGMTEFALRRIARGTYSLRLKKALDREMLPTKGYLRTRIECSDEGEPPNVSDQNIILYVDDINDNAPKFVRKTFDVFFEEGNDQGMEILTAKAIDKDRGQNAKLDYSIVDPDNHSYVAIHRHNGAITAAESFDREKKDRYEFKVLVRDLGDPPLNDTARVILHITDRNDNTPKFVGSYTFRVAEDTSKGTVVGKLNATDPDKGDNGTVEFERTHPYYNTYRDKFRIDPNGDVRVIGNLNREKKSHYTMTVRVKDKGIPNPLSSTTSLLFEIMDVNDSPPRFINFVNSVNLSCADAREHYNVIKLEADDADSLPENRKMKFRLGRYPRSTYSRSVASSSTSSSSSSSSSSSTSDTEATGASKRRPNDYRFEIDPETGAITLVYAPKICKPRSYRLSVSVFDPSKPKFADYKFMSVLILGTPRNSRGDYSGGRRYRPGGSDNSEVSGGYEGDPQGQEGSIDNTILFIIILICVSIIILVLMVAVVLFLRRRAEEQENDDEKEEPMRYSSQPSTCHLGRKELQTLSEGSGALSIDDIYKHGDVELHDKAGGKLDVGKSHYKTMPSNFKEHFNECDDDDDKTHKALLDQQASYESQHTYQSMASQEPPNQHEYTDFNQELFSYIPDSNLNKNKKKSQHYTISFV